MCPCALLHTHARTHVEKEKDTAPPPDQTQALEGLPHRVTEPLLHREDLLLVDSPGGLEQLADRFTAGFPF